MTRTGMKACCLLVLLFAVLHSWAERPRVYAITGVRIVTSPGQVIESGSVIIRDGLIEAVGADVAAPSDAQVIEAEEGWTVYAAFIDAATTTGVQVEEEPPPSGIADIIANLSQPDEPSVGAVHEIDKIRPETKALDFLKMDDKAVSKHRKMGFGAAHILPKRGIFRGVTTVVTMRVGDASDLVLRDQVAQTLALESGSFFGSYPSSAMGTVAATRQALLDAQNMKLWRERYSENPLGMRRPPFESSNEPLDAVLSGDAPVLFLAESRLSHGRFGEIAREFGIKNAMLRATGEEWPVVDRIASYGFPVLYPPVMPDKPSIDNDEDLEDTSLQRMQDYLRAPHMPKKLIDAGVTLAFVTDGMDSVNDLTKNIAAMVKDGGLTADQALAALTTTPAQLLGLDKMLGTVETGKIANLIVVKGDLFIDKPEMRYLFVDGIHEEFEAKESKGDPSKVEDPVGTWEISTTVMGRSSDGIWVISKEGEKFKGYSESDQAGRTDFNSLELEGNALTINLPTPVGTNIDITVIIDGDSLEGETDIEVPQMGSSINVKVTGKRTSNDPQGGRR